MTDPKSVICGEKRASPVFNAQTGRSIRMRRKTDEGKITEQEAYLLKNKWKKEKGEGIFCWYHRDAGLGRYDLAGAIRIQKDMEAHSDR